MMRLVLLAALLVACSKKEDAGPPCDKVVDHMLGLTKQLLAGHGDQQLGDRKAMIDQCEQRKMPASQRTCLLAAKSLDDLGKCRGGGKPTTTTTPTPPGAPPSTAPSAAPAPSTAPSAPAPPTPEPTRPSPTGPEPASGGSGG